MKNKKIDKWWHSLQTRSSLAMLITAAVMIQVSGAVQFFFAREGIRQEVEERAQSEMKMKSLKIQQMVTSLESAVDNIDWLLEWSVENPEFQYTIMEEFVESNPNILGCALAFEPDYYIDKGRWYEPYVRRDEDGTFTRMQIANAEHDYHNMSWYKEGLVSDSGRWTEPYIDNEGAKGMVCTFVYPIKDTKGEVVAVFGADLSLDWLSQEFVVDSNARSYSFIVSREGRIIACPDPSLVMAYTLDEAGDHYTDTMIKTVNKAMLADKSGSAEVRDNDGELAYMYYSPVEGKTGWSMAILFSDREIFKGLRDVALKLGILMLLGLLLMMYIMWRTVKEFKRLEAVNAEKERIGSELRIASNIQSGMLPKTFPPYPDLDELTLYGSLTSAKEVGGDLYDFYVRDNKSFFCIGDVSGKGVPASLVMAVTRSLFRSVSSRIDDPSEIMTQINNAMSEMNENSLFVTLFIGVLDLSDGHLTYSNAGHCTPVLLGGEATPIIMDANIPVGIMADWHFTCQETTLKPGQTLFLYTDGLTEAENALHQQFGEERMMDILAQNNISPRPLIEKILEHVHSFVGYAEQSDDLTMLAIQFTKSHIVSKPNVLNDTLTLHNDIQEIPLLNEFVEKVAAKVNLDPSTTMSLTLALEEAVVNAMKYAYPQDEKGYIEVCAKNMNGQLSFTITDRGTPFDPTQAKEADITLSAEERNIGGLGIHIIRNLMDSVEYHHNGNQNILTLTKKIEQNIQ